MFEEYKQKITGFCNVLDLFIKNYKFFKLYSKNFSYCDKVIYRKLRIKGTNKLSY